MNTILDLQSPAKINWFLKITGRRADGFHMLQTVFQSISLADDIRLTLGEATPGDATLRDATLGDATPGDDRNQKATRLPDHGHSDTGIRCICIPASDSSYRQEDMKLLNDPHNLAYKAAVLLREALAEKNIPCPAMSIEITKRIPMQAGLAGGSSNAAAVLRGFNSLLGSPLSWQELGELACRSGSDTHFCLEGGTQWGEGTGGDLTPMPGVPGWHLVVVKPAAGVSTQLAFEAYAKNQEAENKGLSSGEQRSIRSGLIDKNFCHNVFAANDKGRVIQMMSNSLEQVSMALCPPIAWAKEGLLKAGCLAALMSGSGSAVFGLVENHAVQKKVAEAMRGQGFPDVWAVETLEKK
jgi:4-diphosphocytidyl-2-C-methyl-D-erythritol kinase